MAQEQSFVGFFDVLGFSDLVRNNPHETLQKVYDNALTVVAQLAAAQGRWQVVGSSGRDVAVAALRDAKLKMLLVSDSVILWTGGTAEGFRWLVNGAGLLLDMGFAVGLPLRGALAYGDLTARERSAGDNADVSVVSVFGRSLVDAHDLEQAQQWSGCAVTPEALTAFDALAEVQGGAGIEDMIGERLLRRYRLPLRGGVVEGMAVDWPWIAKDVRSDAMITRAFSMHTKSTDDERVKEKLQQTLLFKNDSRP